MKFLEKEIERLKCRLRKVLCFSCPCPGDSGYPDKAITVSIKNTYCCDHLPGITLIIEEPCCQATTLYIQLVNSCCSLFLHPKPALTIGVACCQIERPKLENVQACCTNTPTLTLFEKCCENNVVLLNLINPCCTISDDKIQLVLRFNCCQ